MHQLLQGVTRQMVANIRHYVLFGTSITSQLNARLERSLISFVRSFLRGGVRPLAVFRRAFSLPPALRPMRPRLVVKPSLGLAQCASRLTLGLVLYIYRAQLSWRVSLAGANMRSSYIRPLALAICCPHRWLSPHPDAPPPSGCDGLSRL